MTMLDLTCPKCGGMMDLSPDKSKCTCPYCDNEVLLEPEQQHLEFGKIPITPEELQSLQENGIPIRPHVPLRPSRTGKLGSGTIAMVLGIISMITFGMFSIFGVVSVITGIRCLLRKPNPTQKAHALIGIITGGIGAFMFFSSLQLFQ